MNPTPSSWSLDSGKEAKNMSDGGKLISPPVPPRPTQTGGYLKPLNDHFYLKKNELYGVFPLVLSHSENDRHLVSEVKVLLAT